jgi:hypothetical protein
MHSYVLILIALKIINFLFGQLKKTSLIVEHNYICLLEVHFDISTGIRVELFNVLSFLFSDDEDKGWEEKPREHTVWKKQKENPCRKKTEGKASQSTSCSAGGC